MRIKAPGAWTEREITATDSSSWASWGRRYITFVTLITCPNYKAFLPVPKGWRTIQIAKKWRSTEEEFWRMCLPVRISLKTNVDGERPELLVSIWMNPHKNWLIKSPWIRYWGVFHGQRLSKMVQMWSHSSCWWNVMKRDDTIHLSFSNP